MASYACCAEQKVGMGCFPLTAEHSMLLKDRKNFSGAT